MSKMSGLALEIETMYIEGLTAEDISISLQFPLQMVQAFIPFQPITEQELADLQRDWEKYHSA